MDWVTAHLIMASETNQLKTREERLLKLDQAANSIYIDILHRSYRVQGEFDDQIKAIEGLMAKLPEIEKDFYKGKIEVIKKERNNYKLFGYAGVEYPEDCKLLKAKHDILNTHFTRKYGRQRIAYSSPYEFTNQLQMILDDIAEDYEGRLKANALVNEYFEKEKEKLNPFGARTIMKSETKSGAGSKEATLPDVDIEDEDITYSAKSVQNSSGTTTTETGDDSLVSKLLTITEYSNFNSRWMKAYINEYGRLFQSIDW